MVEGFGLGRQSRHQTIGINPSLQEYTTPDGTELTGRTRRLETLTSLEAADRGSLTEKQANRAIDTMSRYFEPGKPIYRWFASLARVMDGFGEPYADGSAAHLDLVQEATTPIWSRLREVDDDAAMELLRRDIEFLSWQIEAFRLQAVICTSKMVLENVIAFTRARVVQQGSTVPFDGRQQSGRSNVILFPYWVGTAPEPADRPHSAGSA
jgi:hypothetical protein